MEYFFKILIDQVDCLCKLAHFSEPFLSVARQNGLLSGKKLEMALASQHADSQHTYALIKFLAFLNLVLYGSLVLSS